MPPSLPIETIERAVRFLQGDTPTLAACSLTCHDLLSICRGHLFEAISLPMVPGGLGNSRVRTFLDILDTDSDIALYVRTLTLNAQRIPRVYTVGSRQPWDEGAARLCRRFPGLRSLRLDRFSAPCLYNVLAIALEMPTIEVLTVDDLAVEDTVPCSWPLLDETAVAVTSVAELPASCSLRELSITGGTIPTSEFVKLMSFLEYRRTYIHLDSLSLLVWMWNGIWMFDNDNPCRLEVPSFGRTLRHFGITICDVTADGDVCVDGRKHIERVYAGLKHCSELRSLSIKYDCSRTAVFRLYTSQMDDSTHPLNVPLPFFLDALADLLSEPGLPPFPSLERLSLIITAPLDRALGCAPQIERLAAALVGGPERRYPFFSHLDLRAEYLEIMELMVGGVAVAESELQQKEDMDRFILPMLESFLREGITVSIEIV